MKKQAIMIVVLLSLPVLVMEENARCIPMLYYCSIYGEPVKISVVE